MTDNTYNGWTNYETWMVGLWFNDHFYPDTAKHLDAEVYRDTVFDYVEMALSDGKTGFVSDIIDGFLAAANWAELADHVREAHGCTEEA